MGIHNPLCFDLFLSDHLVEWKFYSVGKAVQSSEPEQKQRVWVIVLFYQRESAMSESENMAQNFH